MATANEERVTRTFLDLVRIDSPTFKEQAICRRLTADLEALGLRVENDRTGQDGIGNLIVRIDGGAGLPIALSAHFDTVQPGRGHPPVHRRRRDPRARRHDPRLRRQGRAGRDPRNAPRHRRGQAAPPADRDRC